MLTTFIRLLLLNYSYKLLGEVSLLMTIPAKATVRAATYTELQVIERKEFMRIMMDYPDAIINLRNDVGNRVQIAHKSNLQLSSTNIIMNLLISDVEEYRPIKLLKDNLLRKKAIKGNKQYYMITKTTIIYLKYYVYD